MARIVVNGLGRTGEVPLRRALEGRPDSAFVLLNEPCAEIRLHALLREFDMVQGRRGRGIKARDDHPSVAGHAMRFSRVKEFRDLPFKNAALIRLSIALALTNLGRADVPSGRRRSENGRFGTVDGQGHAGAWLRCQSRPSRSTRPGCRHCRTLLDEPPWPVCDIMHEEIEIMHCRITIIYCATNNRTIVDMPQQEPGRAHAALNSPIPTSTGSAAESTFIQPEFKGRPKRRRRGERSIRHTVRR
ncbi:MAG: hypothetical protein F4213_10255 [Boseongicola sp. SB0677_bin_26]|nr:hypothetical protein [Boseongicola sp. SB0665_bin_10]MYG26390.1 hypothetical protein [Boseongicola sp. SB0677_bin_26]